MIILEWQQAGLSWLTILKKRENYRKIFYNFNLKKISEIWEKEMMKILKNPLIIRNKLKIKSIIYNAKYFLEIQKEFWSFQKYLNNFTEWKIFQFLNWEVETKLSKKISKDLKKRWFKFIWSKIIFSYLEAIWIYNNHQKDCFLYKKI